MMGQACFGYGGIPMVLLLVLFMGVGIFIGFALDTILPKNL